MKCYFCHNDLTQLIQYQYPCPSCKEMYKLQDVIMCTDIDDRILFAHMYLTDKDYRIIHLPGAFGLTSIEVGKKYHVRLHLREDFTVIASPLNNEYNHITNLPGFPLNPSNIHQKLKTYILFS